MGNASLSIEHRAEAAVIDRTTGKTLATTELSGRTLTLYGAESPGDEWQVVDEIEVDANGEFSVAIPGGLRFFRLEAEVPR